MARFHYVTIFVITSLLFLFGCAKKPSDPNAIYYWRTTFTLSNVERDFLQQHNVSKLYVHFFDVAIDWDRDKRERVVPEASIQFKDSIPSGIEIIPTVYITTAAMEEMQLKEDFYAEKIMKRVNAMCRRHHIDFKEVQLDCDWNKGTRHPFFKLCEEMKRRLGSTKMLSSTIRLHQLIQTPPPVDKGVLMVYNTGNLRKKTTDNSIFSRKDIAPYLQDNRLAEYALPLDIAYPAYGWSIAFAPYDGNYHFKKIIRETDFSTYPQLKKIGSNIYKVTESVKLNSDVYVYEDCQIRVERPTANDILEVKSMIEKQLKYKPHNNILYHLDKSQLSYYSNYEINQIYSHH